MIGRIILTLVAVPVGLLIVLLAVANRGPLTLSFDPLLTQDIVPAAQVTVPAYLVFFALLICGVLIGGLASWWKARRWKRAARLAGAEAARLREEIARLRRGEAEAPAARGTAALPMARRDAA